MSPTEVLVALAILVGLVGVIVPILPGLVLVLAAILVWAISEGSATGWTVFAVAALLMAWDFLLKLGPLYPRFVERITKKSVARMQPGPGE